MPDDLSGPQDGTVDVGSGGKAGLEASFPTTMYPCPWTVMATVSAFYKCDEATDVGALTLSRSHKHLQYFYIYCIE